MTDFDSSDTTFEKKLPYIIFTSIFIIVYSLYQLTWYYPIPFRQAFGLEQKSKPKSRVDPSTSSPTTSTAVVEEKSEEIFFYSKKIAHRGCRLEGLPENSLAAFYYALEKDYADVIECDVWLTKDQEVIVHHDPSLLRMTGCDLHINDTNYSDFPSVLTNIPHQSEFISTFMEEHKGKHVTLYYEKASSSITNPNKLNSEIPKVMETPFSSEYKLHPSLGHTHLFEKELLVSDPMFINKIPTFLEVISLVYYFNHIRPKQLQQQTGQMVVTKKKYLIIELKENSWELISKLNHIIHTLHMEHEIFWFSLDEKININLMKFNEKLYRITSIQGMLLILAQYYLGILPFMKIQNHVFGITVEQITMEKVQHEKATEKLPYAIQYFLTVLFMGRPPYLMISKKLFTHMRRRGIPVWFLGVNNVVDLQLAIDYGATAVLTDRIQWLHETLKTKGLTFTPLYE